MKLHLKIHIGKEYIRNEVREDTTCFCIVGKGGNRKEVDPETPDQFIPTPIESIYIFPEADADDCEEIPEKHICIVIGCKDRRREKNALVRNVVETTVNK